MKSKIYDTFRIYSY